MASRTSTAGRAPRVEFSLTAAQRRELRRRAGLHGLTVADYLRRVAVGAAPSLDDADRAWFAASPTRRQQLLRAGFLGRRPSRAVPMGDPLPFGEP